MTGANTSGKDQAHDDLISFYTSLTMDVDLQLTRSFLYVKCPLYYFLQDKNDNVSVKKDSVQKGGWGSGQIQKMVPLAGVKSVSCLLLRKRQGTLIGC